MEAKDKDAARLRGYTRLQVWHKGISLASTVYDVTKGFPASERFGLASQMRRASVSVPSNTAEGQARGSAGEFRHFLRIALGSLAELDTQAVIAGELKMCDTRAVDTIRQAVAELQMMIGALLPSIED